MTQQLVGQEKRSINGMQLLQWGRVYSMKLARCGWLPKVHVPGLKTGRKNGIRNFRSEFMQQKFHGTCRITTTTGILISSGSFRHWGDA